MAEWNLNYYEEMKMAEEGTEPPARTPGEQLVDFLNHMGTFLLYPMVREAPPARDIADYVREVKPLFLRGSAASPQERYEYSSKAFDLVAHLMTHSPRYIRTLWAATT